MKFGLLIVSCVACLAVSCSGGSSDETASVPGLSIDAPRQEADGVAVTLLELSETYAFDASGANLVARSEVRVKYTVEILQDGLAVLMEPTSPRIDGLVDMPRAAGEELSAPQPGPAGQDAEEDGVDTPSSERAGEYSREMTYTVADGRPEGRGWMAGNALPIGARYFEIEDRVFDKRLPQGQLKIVVILATASYDEKALTGAGGASDVKILGEKVPREFTFTVTR